MRAEKVYGLGWQRLRFEELGLSIYEVEKRRQGLMRLRFEGIRLRIG